jgi:hypothetical protein
LVSENENLNVQVENRLEDLFGEGDINSPVSAEGGDLEYYPFRILKSIVLSMDWEINDEVLGKFIEQIDGLKDTYKEDKILLLFLQILHSLGTYIKAKKGGAHPNAFKIINSVFTRLEKVVLSKNLSEASKKKMLFAELSKFKELRGQIALSNANKVKKKKTEKGIVKNKIIPEAKPVPSTVQKEKEAPGGLISSGTQVYDGKEIFINAVEEIKNLIRTEFAALKEELKLIKR